MISRGMGSLLRQMEYSKLRVMVVPYPAQGHINPMLQFAQRLVSKKVMVTFVLTEADREGMFQAQDASISSQEIQFETISDGLPLDFDRSKDLEMAMQMLCKMGGLTLTNLIERLNAQGNNISCIVYDSFLPWVPEVANKFDIPLAFFWTQSSAVYSIYYYFSRGLSMPSMLSFFQFCFLFLSSEFMLILFLLLCSHPGRWKRENDGRDRNSRITAAERMPTFLQPSNVSAAFSNRSV
jgi:hypothetical protein